MSRVKSIVEEILNEEELFEISNIRKKYTRLPVNIWLDDIGAYRKNTHYKPRIKFQANKSDKVMGIGIPMSISVKPEVLIDDPKTELNSYEIGQVKNFIVRNYDLLMKYWNQEIDILEFLQKVKKV